MTLRVFLFCPTMEEMIIKFEKLAELAKIRITLEGADKEVLNVHVSVEDTIGEITLQYWYDRDELEQSPNQETERTTFYTWVSGNWVECTPKCNPF